MVVVVIAVMVIAVEGVGGGRVSLYEAKKAEAEPVSLGTSVTISPAVTSRLVSASR